MGSKEYAVHLRAVRGREGGREGGRERLTGIKHARHTDRGARAHGEQKRVVRVSELFPRLLLDDLDGSHIFLHQAKGEVGLVGEVLEAGGSADDEAGGLGNEGGREGERERGREGGIEKGREGVN